MDTEQLEINTTQNVRVSYEPAAVGDRMLSYLLDLLIWVVYGLIALLFVPSLIIGSSNDEATVTLGYVIGSVLSLPFLCYHLIFEIFMNGQTIGYKVMNIKVVKLDGSQPSAGAYAIRWMFRLIDCHILNPLFPMVALISVMATRHGQRLGDMAAGTTVIRLTPKASLHNTILYKARPDYKLTFESVNKLNDRDIRIIKEVYQQCRQSRDFNALMKLALKVKSTMGLEGSLNMSAEQFINIVLADYSQYEFDK